MGGVLDGIRVLDFGRFIAAPWCSAILADLGADVIRVEKREGGEDRWVQAVTDGGEGGTYLQCNRNKRSLTLDPTTADGAEVTRRLVAQADVVVANMPLAALEANGIDYDSLRAVKPDIVAATASAYGEGGPYSERIGFDGTGQVMSGATWRQGTPEQPIRTVVPYADFGTALTLATGVMAALMHHRATGEGQHVTSALLPTAMMMANSFLIESELIGGEKPRMGNQGTSVAPCDLFEVDDGFVLLQVAGNPMFRRWCRLVGHEELIEDPRFAGDDLRWDESKLLNGIMAEWCRGRTKAEAIALLEAARLPAAPVQTPAEVLVDPQVTALGFLERVPYPGASRPVPITPTPFTLSATPGTIRTRAPMLGEHTDEILARLGYDAAAREDLRARGVI